MKLQLLVAVALAWPAAAGAQNQPAATAETVALRFAWPASLNATVASERIRVRKSETADSSAAAVTYHMQSGKGQGDERLVRFSDFELEVPAQTEARVQEMIEQIAQLVPSYRINNAGEFLGVYEVAKLKARMDTMMAPLLADDSSGQLQSLVASLVSEQYLNGVTAQEWNALVGTWVGADLELGQVYELEEQAPVPIIPDATVKMVSEFAVEARVPCAEDAQEKQCVQIHLYAEPDSAAMKAVLQQFIERIAGSGAAAQVPVFDDLSIRSELLLITRPETLVPHYLELVKTVEGRGRLGSESAPFSQTDRRRYWYTYDE
jgi:hypothetical protein